MKFDRTKFDILLAIPLGLGIIGATAIVLVPTFFIGLKLMCLYKAW